MNLFLEGHDLKYATEQILITLFPGEKPIYPEGPCGEGERWARVSLIQGAVYVTGKTELFYGGKTHTATSRAKTLGLAPGVELDRALQKALKLSFYRAAVAALGKAPPWGALTGVRPVKVPTKALLRGESAAKAEALLRDTYHVGPVRRRLAMDCARASIAAQKALGPDQVSLYVGIPFCPTRCAYCSFVSADVGRTLKLVEPYLEALHREIAVLGALLRTQGLSVRTVYIGGGTPTTLSAPQLAALMDALATHIDLSRCTEYTVEAGRPDTITAEKLAALKAGGAGRVSVNPQTMHDSVLAAMGRSHSAADILSACDLVRQSGLSCVNMDLIAGLPTDSVAGFRASLDRVIALAPENITVHTLALKKGSTLKTQGGHIPCADEVAAMLSYAWGTLRASGYAPYYLYRQKYMSGSFENVGWAHPGYASLYNIAMMEELHSVLSVGGGGVTKLVDSAAGKIKRLANPKYPYEYIADIERLCADKAQIADFYATLRRD